MIWVVGGGFFFVDFWADGISTVSVGKYSSELPIDNAKSFSLKNVVSSLSSCEVEINVFALHPHDHGLARE